MKITAKKNKFYIIFLIFFLVNLVKSTANSQVDNNKNTIKIDGDAEPASLADIPLSKFEYDIDSFESGFNPGKELIDLLDRPEELTGMKEQNFAQEFPIEK